MFYTGVARSFVFKGIGFREGGNIEKSLNVIHTFIQYSRKSDNYCSLFLGPVIYSAGSGGHWIHTQYEHLTSGYQSK